MSLVLVVLGWAAFAGGAVWSYRHEPPPFRYSFGHCLPGSVMLFGLLFALWPRPSVPLLADAREEENVAMAGNCLTGLTVILTLGPLIILLFLAWFGWGDARPYYPTYPPSTTVEPGDEHRRGIFSISSGPSHTTKPPPTPSLPPVYPSGSAIPPGMLVLHGVILALSISLAVLSRMWRDQDRAEKASDGGGIPL